VSTPPPTTRLRWSSHTGDARPGKQPHLSLFLSPGRVGVGPPPPSSAPYRRRVASTCKAKIGARSGRVGAMPQNPAIWRGGWARPRSRATRGK
jgi:hypothetical protein